MKSKTELLLYRLLWLAEKPMRPTFHNISQSFEGWAYYSGLLTQVDRLEAQGFLEAKRDPRTGERLHRLTEAGRRAALAGRDPETAWMTPWDGKWRLFLFDIPENERSKRRQLTRALSAAGCGCLQGSVWIAAHTPPPLAALLSEDDPECSELLLLLADSKGKRLDLRMATAAWDFETVNECYQALLAALSRFPSVAESGTHESLENWTAAENRATRAALAVDPLLPAELLPPGYLGRKAWRQRKRVLAEAARLAATLGAGRETG